MSVRRGIPVIAGVLIATSCSGGSPLPDDPPDESEGVSRTTAKASPPSLTREVPRGQRQELGKLSGQQLCELVKAEDLRELAFEVEPGTPHELTSQPPAQGCLFEAPQGVRSIMLGAQPSGYGDLGRDEVELGETRGSETLYANDCTVFVEVENATLQVVVTVAEADSDQCEMAESIAQYTLPALAQ